jgi:hypothetical protein
LLVLREAEPRFAPNPKPLVKRLNKEQYIKRKHNVLTMAVPSAELMARVLRATSAEQKAIIAAEVVQQQVCCERESFKEKIARHLDTKVENERFLEELFEDCETQLGIDNNITIDIFFVLFDSYISMCGSAACTSTRWKILLLLHVSPRQDRFAACSCCACNRAPRCCRRC